MKIQCKKSFHYFLIYLIVIMQGSVLFFTHSDQITVLALVISIFYLLMHKSIWKDVNIVFVMCLGVSLFLEIIYTNGSLSIGSVFSILTRFLIAIVAYYFNKKEFCHRYVKLVVLLSIFSLIIFSIQLINYDLITSILPKVEHSGTNYYGFFCGSIADWHKTRNIGLSGEPGRHQIYLITAIYFILFKSELLHNEDERNVKYFVILLLTLFTTGSTTGFISLIILLCGFIINMLNNQNNKKLNKKIKKILVLGCSIVLIYYIYSGTDNFIYKNFVSKLFNTSGKIDVMVSTGRSRTISMLTDWKLALKYPLGMGYQNYNSMWLTSKVENISDLSSCCGITMALATLGFHNVLLILGYYIKKAKDNCLNIIEFLVMLGILINNSFTQTSLYFTPIIIMFLVQRETSVNGGKRKNEG